MKSDYLILFVVLILVALFGAALFLAREAPEITYKPIDVGGGSITIADQTQLDTVVFDVELAAPGFVTIHRTMSAAPAEIIGISQYLEAGSYANFTMQLQEEMLPGYKYAALLHADNGDKIYVTDDDLPVTTDGEVVRPYFVATPTTDDLTATAE